MADILRGYGLAREQGFFKQEQEADLQKHRQRLIQEGRLPAEPEKKEAAGEDEEEGEEGASTSARPRQQQGFAASEHDYETLAEVLQQQARLDDPHALRRREYERRIRGEPPPLSDADLRRARSKLHALGSSVGHVPGRVSMGRNRWAVPEPAAAGVGGGGNGEMVAAVRMLTPEAREVASRTYVAGVRALVYGSLLGAVGLAAAATYYIRSAGIQSGEDFGDKMRGGLEPMSAALRGWLVPFKERAQEWLGPLAPAADGQGGGSGGGRGAFTAEFSQRLQEKLNLRRRDGGSGGSGGGGGGGAEPGSDAAAGH